MIKIPTLITQQREIDMTQYTPSNEALTILDIALRSKTITREDLSSDKEEETKRLINNIIEICRNIDESLGN